MQRHTEWNLSDYLRCRQAAVQQANRLRNEALWSAPGMLWRGWGRLLGAGRRWWLRPHGWRA